MTRRPPSFAPSGTAARGTVNGGRRNDGAVVRVEPAAVESAEPVEPVEVEPAAPAPPPRVSGGLADRLAERQRARRRLRFRAVAIVAAAVLLLAGAGYVALASPVLALDVEEVSLTGTNEVVTAEDVLAVVQPYDGEPLLRLDTPGLRQELLGVTGVLDVAVSRDLPHGLVIEVTPRVPVASVQQDDVFVLLDAEGVELARSSEAPEGVPVVSVPVGTEDTADALAAVLEVMASLPASILEQVERASAETAYEVQFRLASGALVVWGSAEDNELKARVLQTLLQVPAQLYDVSAPLSPITK